MKKIALFLLAVVCLVSLFAITASADVPTVAINGVSLGLEDRVCLLYRVSVTGELPEGAEVLMQFSKDAPTSGEWTYTTAEPYRTDSNYYYFSYNGQKPMQMTESVYCRAELRVNENSTYSDYLRYSVLDYAHDTKNSSMMLANGEATLGEMVQKVLEYGTASQQYFGYHTDRLPTDDYYFVRVEGGTLSDGVKNAIVFDGDSVTITADEPDGYQFAHWEDEDGNTISNNATVTLYPTVDATYSAVFEEIPVVPKNIIFLIPDGAGFGTYDIANAYKQKYAASAVDGIVDGIKDTAYATQATPITTNAIEGKTVTGLYLDDYMIATANTDMYHSQNSATDSAAAGTALLCGVKTDYVMVGIDHEFNPVANILELARLEGKATGAVSTKCSVDATTSDMTVHLLRRPDQNGCAYQTDASAQMLNNNIDIQLMYGTDGGRYPYNKVFANSVPVNDDTAANHGYTVVTDLSSLNAAVNNGDTKIFSSFQIDYTHLGSYYDIAGNNYYASNAAWNTDYQAHHILYDVDAREGDLTLMAMAQAALKMLDENVNDPAGFCLVIEGGAIDNACEGRNVKEGVAEYLAFDEVWGYCVNWAMQRGDTIVIACPDHDSGGFYDPSNTAGAPRQGSKDYDSLDDLLTALHNGTVSDRTTLDGYSSGHTAQNVPVWLYAPDSVRAEILEYLGIPADTDASKVRSGLFYNGSVFDSDYEINNSDIAHAVVEAAGLMTFSEATSELFVPIYDANSPEKYNYGTYDTTSGLFVFSNGARASRNSRIYYDKDGNEHSLSCGLPIFLTNPVNYHTEDGTNVTVPAGQATAVFYVPRELLDNIC